MNQHLTLVEKTCNEIVIGIPEELETTFRQEECIYKAPAAIRNLNGPAYTPQVISIGPFHHDSENLQPMEIQKQRYLKEFCKRLRWQPKEQVHKSLKELLNIIEDREVKIKRCYAAEIKSERFLKIILLDAVFIFELFLKNNEYSVHPTKYKHDFIIGKPWLRAAIQRDLILLENQLPFFILEELYNHATRTSTCYCMATFPPFLDLSCNYFENYGKSKTLPDETKHFTDLVRYFLSSKHPTLESPDRKQRKQHFTDRVRDCLPFMHRKPEPPIKNPD
ncbi:hypothetical protein OIU77_010095 [Salix suchowensis]|uniref:Uncharacterized protein n=1 Tax=Salix suchowensis TaxID=1278906 RepID=A0ABQ9A884_9ROSI|nr:hypothetical protein OIU77_010095 [Salix suchowensis]